MYKNIRAMMNPGWREDKWYPEKRQLYEKIQQPTMETWLEKTQIMTMLTQTREKENDTPQALPRNGETKKQTARTMEKRRAALQKNKDRMRNHRKNRHKNRCMT